MFDSFEDGLKVVLNLSIGDAEDAIAKGAQVGIPIPIVNGLSHLFVNGAVELEDKS